MLRVSYLFSMSSDSGLNDPLLLTLRPHTVVIVGVAKS